MNLNLSAAVPETTDSVRSRQSLPPAVGFERGELLRKVITWPVLM